MKVHSLQQYPKTSSESTLNYCLRQIPYILHSPTKDILSFLIFKKKKHHFLLSCKTCMSFDHMTFVVWKEGSCESNVAWSNLLLHAFKSLINHFLASRTFKGFKTYVSLKITIFLGPAIINHGSISPILVWQAIKLNYLVVINTLLRTYRVPEFWCGWD